MNDAALLEQVFYRDGSHRDVVVDADLAALVRTVDLFLAAGWRLLHDQEPFERAQLDALLAEESACLGLVKQGVQVNAFFGRAEGGGFRELDFAPREIDAANVGCAAEALQLIAQAMGGPVRVTPEGSDAVLAVAHADRLEAGEP